MGVEFSLHWSQLVRGGIRLKPWPGPLLIRTRSSVRVFVSSQSAMLVILFFSPFAGLTITTLQVNIRVAGWVGQQCSDQELPPPSSSEWPSHTTLYTLTSSATTLWPWSHLQYPRYSLKLSALFWRSTSKTLNSSNLTGSYHILICSCELKEL